MTEAPPIRSGETVWLCPFQTHPLQILKQHGVEMHRGSDFSAGISQQRFSNGIGLVGRWVNPALKKMSLVSRCVKQLQSKCNFSIDHILNVAGEKSKAEDFGIAEEDFDEKKFEWLNCTRYRPPKLQRQRKRDGIQRRKLGRNPRIPFSSSQVAFLEAKFVRTPYLSSSDVTQLAANLQLSETRVKIWFQNRRARERRDRDAKNKVCESSKDARNQRLSPRLRDCSRLENMFIEQCFFPASAEDGTQNGKEEGMNFYNSIRNMQINGGGNYLQFLTPLDLSERQIICK